jgi:hypothetical protein
MLRAKILWMIFFSLLMLKASAAGDQKKELQKYISEIVNNVKEAKTPAEKRETLNDLFMSLQKAFDAAKNSPYVPESDYSGIDILKNKIADRHDELNGINGFNRVPDNRLDQFASFTLHDIEQADSTVTIGIGTLIIIILLAILVF